MPCADHLPQLGPVRRDDRRALVSRVVVALRIDQHALLRPPGKLDHLADVRHAALAVVGKDHHVAIGQRRLVLRELGGQHLARGRALEIHAQELLLPADHAQLLRRADRAVAMQPRIDAVLLQQPLERAAGIVVADD